MIMMMGLQPIQLKPMVKPFLIGMAPEVGPMLAKNFDMKTILSVEKLCAPERARTRLSLPQRCPPGVSPRPSSQALLHAPTREREAGEARSTCS